MHAEYFESIAKYDYLAYAKVLENGVFGVSVVRLGVDNILNTVLIIEHNMDVIKIADYIIDVGYEGGKNGGEIIAKGTPEEIIKNKKSYTAKFLKKELS